jgi:PGF-CTERM protein
MNLADAAAADISGNGTIAGKGVVTIMAAGSQSYPLGEEIQFSGTNTAGWKTYLFLTGPNLPDNGANIASIDTRDNPSKDNDLSTFKSLDVNGDHTWSWKWGTANYKLDSGSYTVYAVSQPLAKGSLEQAAYGTVSIIIKRPLVSATPVANPTPAHSPGYGALIALIGLGACAFIAVRR